MGTLINLSDYRRKYDPNTVYVGDIVQWKDFDGKIYESVVKNIVIIPDQSGAEHEPAHSLPLDEKEYYCVGLRHSLLLSATTIIKKVIPSQHSRLQAQVVAANAGF